MTAVAIACAHALDPENLWDKSISDLLVDAAAPAIAGVAIDAIFCAAVSLPGPQADWAAVAADRLGLQPNVALTFASADVSGAAALYSAWQHVRAGLCRNALVLAAAKVSDVSELERIALHDLALDPDADIARGIDFTTQAGLLAGHYCREAKIDAAIFAETTAANLAAWGAYKGRPVPTSAELRRDLPVSPPLVRSDFAQLLDGGCALVLCDRERTERALASIEAVSSGVDVVSVWERKDPLSFAAAEGAAARIVDRDTDAPAWLEIDAAVSIAQCLGEVAVRRAAQAARPGPASAMRVNRRGGAQGRGRVFGASALYQLADICEIASRGETALLLAVAGLGHHVFGARLSGLS